MSHANVSAPPSRIGQLLRFAATGLLATSVHFAVLTATVELAGLPAPMANGIAFSLALWVSYIGQSYWVFRNPMHHFARVRRFLTTAFGGLIANVAIMAIAVDILGLPYQVGFLAALIIVPVVTFVVSKFWVFRPDSAA